MTKIIISVFILLLSCSVCLSQCEVEAGMDRNACPDEILDGVSLEGQILEGNNVSIYWESSYYEPSLNQTYYASHMMNDTTSLNPVITDHFEKTVVYYLNGIDAANQTCQDSVVINFSDWQFLAIDKMTGKDPLDTIELWIAAQSNWEHVQYEWSPNIMISDTTLRNPKVWNDTTIFYNLEITDSLGCTVTDDIFEVYVSTSSISEISKQSSILYPNPASDHFQIESKENIYSIEIYDQKGSLLMSKQKQPIVLDKLPMGEYYIRIKYNSGKMETQILIISK